MKISDYKNNVYSQFGEDGVVDFILGRIGVESRVCVEFGAGDGLSCSNTAVLWRDQDWKAVLIEPELTRFESLEGNAGTCDTICRRAFVTPTGPLSIDTVLEEEDIDEVDYMSIDVDGDDYAIFAAMECRPRMVSIEFNPTIPPHVDARQKELGEEFGASLLALIRLGESKGYRFIGATYCNAFFVDSTEEYEFEDCETEPSVLFSPGEYTYAVSDFAGRIVLIGQAPPWGTRGPYVKPVEVSAYALPPTDNPHEIRRGFESLWGTSLLLSPNGLSVGRLVEILAPHPPVVCIDLSTSDLDATAWMGEKATEMGYVPLLVGRVLGLIYKDSYA